jgi:hypothetical protein
MFCESVPRDVCRQVDRTDPLNTAARRPARTLQTIVSGFKRRGSGRLWSSAGFFTAFWLGRGSKGPLGRVLAADPAPLARSSPPSLG